MKAICGLWRKTEGRGALTRSIARIRSDQNRKSLEGGAKKEYNKAELQGKISNESELSRWTEEI